MKKKFFISVCIPAFNEEENLKEAISDLYRSLSNKVKNFEIIIVDDGSTDDTSAIAQELNKEYNKIKVIRHNRNKGMGACFKSALENANGDLMTWFPSDHENSAEEIIRGLSQLKENHIVTSYHCDYDRRPRYRRMLSRFYTWSLNRWFGLNLKYYNGLTIAPTKFLRSAGLSSNGFTFSSEIIIKAIKAGYSVTELSTPLRGRISGTSKAIKFSSLVKICQDGCRIYKQKR